MGRDVRIDEGADRPFADACGDIPAAFRLGLRLHLAPVERPPAGRRMARRSAAGRGRGDGRIVLFPDRKHGAGIRPGVERVADRLHGAGMDRAAAEPRIPRRADDAAADRGIGAGVRGHGAGGSQRPFRAAPPRPKAICWPCPRRCCRWSIRWRSNASEGATPPFSSPARSSSTDC